MTRQVPKGTCLHCGQSREEVKRRQSFCATVSGYEEPEIDAEWPRHRWTDWTDKNLAAMGLAPHAFAAHRRTDAQALESHWGEVKCDEFAERKHRYPSQEDVDDWEKWWAESLNRCTACWGVFGPQENPDGPIRLRSIR